MNNKEIHDEAQKFEDALKDNDSGQIAKMLAKDTSACSPEDFKKIMDEWKAINAHDRAADKSLPSMELAAGLALYDSMCPPEEEKDSQASIAAADNAAGEINNQVVVDASRIGAGKAARAAIRGSTANEQYAIARISAAIDAAEAKLAAGQSSGVGGDYAAAQQFGSPEAYQAYLKQQADQKAAAEKKE